MELLRNGRPRVVITGLGAVTALGPVPELWENIIAGKSGIRRLETINTEHVSVKIGGEVRGFDPTQYIDRKEARRMGRASHFTIAAAQMAAEDAGYTPEELEKVGERVSVVVGTSLGAHEMSEKSTTKYKTDGYRKPNPLNMINALPNMPAHYVSRYMRAFGPLITPSAACASGTQSVGEGMELIRRGRADIVFAGGVEAIMQDYVLEAFYAMTALATEYNDNPSAASRPFDLNRSGFCLSEGAAIVVMESLAHALKRGAHIYAEVIGHASSSDAYHVAALDPEGLGAYRSMKWALEDAHLDTEQIQYINAHGTSTPANDLMETQAIKRLFGEYAYELWVSSTKSMLGHAMAASGAIEAVLLAKILEERVVPPTINYDTPDPECDLDYVPNEAREMPDLEYAMSNSFGLGGQNATIVMRRFN
ncbi:MAG: beta-ketoacyl-[acyl-carrier-protein] synthase family protein [Chloroflexi bacterium]|nr:MAG: beta-ketoacyl-[acyl-carrier-protein] synthase family protein [Chloroflexota bacterium]